MFGNLFPSCSLKAFDKAYSSPLTLRHKRVILALHSLLNAVQITDTVYILCAINLFRISVIASSNARSEERRVGKEWRSRLWRDADEKEEEGTSQDVYV